LSAPEHSAFVGGNSVQPSSDTGFASELVQVLNGFQQSCLSDILCVFSVSTKLASKSVNFLSVTPNFFRLHHKTIAPSGKGAFSKTPTTFTANYATGS
jgi:hypothetical protein